MTVARRTIVEPDSVGVYHCISRCVRRAFLCGVDDYTGKNYEHRRGWIAERLKVLSGLFAVDVFAYAVMSNHLHVVIRNRPDHAGSWTAEEVARRWSELFPKRNARGEVVAPDAAFLAGFVADAARVATCRERLGDISWFMRCLNEPIARRSNREDKCTGRFWEGRFKCQRLMDEGAILACMAYVDLNPVRAQLAQTLEDSEFTSVYDRIVAERGRKRLERVGELSSPSVAQTRLIEQEEKQSKRADWLLDLDGPESPLVGLGLEYYLSLVEWTGRNIREDKPGYIPAELKPVFDRFALDTEQWVKNVEGYGSLFYRVAGRLEQMLECAQMKGQRWFRGRSGSERLYRGERAAA
jgi:putative transposase